MRRQFPQTRGRGQATRRQQPPLTIRVDGDQVRAFTRLFDQRRHEAEGRGRGPQNLEDRRVSQPVRLHVGQGAPDEAGNDDLPCSADEGDLKQIPIPLPPHQADMKEDVPRRDRRRHRRARALLADCFGRTLVAISPSMPRSSKLRAQDVSSPMLTP